MNQSFPDLVKMAKQIQAQEQELRTLQLATKEAKSQWDAQKKQIAEETRVRIETSKEAITEAIKNDKKDLGDLNGSIVEVKKSLETLTELYQARTSKLGKEIEVLENQKKVALESKLSITEKHQALKKEVANLQQELANFNIEKDSVAINISALREEANDLKDQTTAKADKLEDIAIEISKLEEEFDSKKLQMTKDLELLQAKTNKQAQQLVESQANESKMRESLAYRQRELDERDKNLRIREARAEQSEAKIAQNANLLNI